jgi:hypothetical protein
MHDYKRLGDVASGKESISYERAKDHFVSKRRANGGQPYLFVPSRRMLPSARLAAY